MATEVFHNVHGLACTGVFHNVIDSPAQVQFYVYPTNEPFRVVRYRQQKHWSHRTVCNTMPSHTVLPMTRHYKTHRNTNYKVATYITNAYITVVVASYYIQVS